MADLAKAGRWLGAGFGAAFLVYVGGMEGLRLTAYADPGAGWKLPTICAGHTKGVRRGDHATATQCQQYLDVDLKAAGREVARCVVAPISEGQFDALVDFEFNTGRLCASGLLRQLNSGNCHGAAREFDKWVKAGGKVQPGLVRRRAAERQMFEKDC
jgi:lysozyme